MGNALIDCLIGWLVGWFFVSLFVWLGVCLVGQPVVSLAIVMAVLLRMFYPSERDCFGNPPAHMLLHFVLLGMKNCICGRSIYGSYSRENMCWSTAPDCYWLNN